MTTLHPTLRRLAAALAAATTTLTLFSAVVSIGEPQRGELLAKSRPAAANTVTATAPVRPVAADTAPAAADAPAVRIADASAQ